MSLASKISRTGTLLAVWLGLSASLAASEWEGTDLADSIILSGDGSFTFDGQSFTGINIADAGSGADSVRFEAKQSHPERLSYRNFESFEVDFQAGFPALSAPEVTISGDLTLTDFNVTPVVGQSYQIIQAVIITGTFGSFDLPDVSAFGLEWDTSELPLNGRIRLVSDTDTVTITQSSLPSGIVPTSSLTQPIGSNYQTPSFPLVSGNERFAFWTFNGVRQDAPGGRAFIRPNITLTENLAAVATFFSAGEDGDGDRLEDWWEFWMFGTRDRAPSENIDGDAFDHEKEFTRGYDATAVDAIQDGGMSLRFSATTAYVKQGAHRYEYRSDPIGLQSPSEVYHAPGEIHTSPDLPFVNNTRGYQFVGWFRNGLRVVDNSAVSRSQAVFEVNEATELIARYARIGADTDGDSILDTNELRIADSLATYDESSDPDNDSFTLGVEQMLGYSMTGSDLIRSGGISIRFSVGRSVDFTVPLTGFYAYMQQEVGPEIYELGVGVSLFDDYDQDGIINLLEYAHGLDVLLPDREAYRELTLALLKDETGGLFLNYGRAHPAPEGVRYVIQKSSNLRTWIDVSETELTRENVIDGDFDFSTLGPIDPLAGSEQTFYRLKIRYAL
jgi:hypothetical protein